jgi:hypothetical protein
LLKMRKVFVFVLAAGTLSLGALTAGCPSSTTNPATVDKAPKEQDRAAKYQQQYTQKYSGGGGQQGGGGGAAMPPGPGTSR